MPLLLSLRFWEEAFAGGDVSFAITGVAASPAVGEIEFPETSSGGIWPSVAERLRAEAPRAKRFRVRGVAAGPAVGSIDEVAISIQLAPARTTSHQTDALGIVHVDFGFEGAPQARAYAGRRRARIATDFRIHQGVAANTGWKSFINPVPVETVLDLTEDEWLGLVLAAA